MTAAWQNSFGLSSMTDFDLQRMIANVRAASFGGLPPIYQLPTQNWQPAHRRGTNCDVITIALLKGAAPRMQIYHT